MNIDWARVLPVIVSILIIIAIAILREYSRTFAAITATMPLGIPLAMWLVASGTPDQQAVLREFSSAILINIIPTIIFIIVAWLTARAGWGLAPTIGAGYVGWGLAPTIGAGYVGWGLTLGVILLLRLRA